MSTTEIEIAFPKVTESSINLPVNNLPAAPADQVLAEVSSTPEKRRTLSCKDLLVGDTRQQAEQEAAKRYHEMITNEQVFFTYGTQALQAVNDLIDRLMKETNHIKVPEIRQIMKGLNDDMRGYATKYDPADPKVRERYEKGVGLVKKFLSWGKDWFEMFLEDITSIDHQLDKVKRELLDRRDILVRNVAFYDELYDENEREILQLIYVIGVMELIRDLAANEAAGITVGNEALGDRRQEQKANIAQFAESMEIKIAAYKGRLIVAWATSPQIRTMRVTNVMLTTRVNELAETVIPTMKSTIVQWRFMAEQQQVNQLANDISRTANETIQAFAKSAAEVIPAIVDGAETPSITPETIHAMAESLAKQAQGIIEAIDKGAERREAMDIAMLDAQKVFHDTTNQVSDAIIDRVVARATQPPEVATSVA